MDVICPKCLAPLRVEGDAARCSPACGGEFKVLFSRESAEKKTGLAPPGKEARASLPATPSSQPGKCGRHPNVDAEFVCARCGASICRTCAFPQPDGSQKCPNCILEKKSVVPAPAARSREPLGNEMCVNHPEARAVVRCDKCHTPICRTCEFSFPGDIHVCPKCAASGGVISPKRRKALTWSLVLGGLTSLLFVLFFVIFSNLESGTDVEMLGTIMGMLILAGGIAGTCIGFSAIDKRRENTFLMWLAAIWNLLLVVGYLLLCVIGIFME